MSRKSLIPLLTATFYALVASSLVVPVMSSAAHAKVTRGPPGYPPQAEQCENQQPPGIWNYIIAPPLSGNVPLCGYSGNFSDGSPGGGAYYCGHCYRPNFSDCFTTGGQWVPYPKPPSTEYRCLLPNNRWLKDYPGFCNGSMGGTANAGELGVPPCGGVGGDEFAGSPAGIDCSEWGLVENGTGGCTGAGEGNTFDPAGYCLDNGRECFGSHGYIFVNLPVDVNCLFTMDLADPPLICHPPIVTDPGNGGHVCLVRGGSIALDIRARQLVCWSKANAMVPRAGLAVPPYDEKAKSVLANCRAKGHSVTLRDGALACVESPSDVTQAVAQHFAAAPQLSCKPPMMPNRDRSACVCPPGAAQQGQECVRPIECRPPMIPNGTGTACVCPPGTVQRGQECVRPTECRPPMIPNGTGTACVCPPGTVQRGQECIRPIECRPPMVPNGAGTACVCPPGTVQRGQECIRPIECRPPMIHNGAGTACVCPPGTVQRGQECVRQIECRPPMIHNGAGTACVCPPGTVQRGQECVRQIECRPPMIHNGAGTACVCPPGTAQRGQECVRQN
jgi:hypothetical protein